MWHVCLLLSLFVLFWCKSTGKDGEFDPEQTKHDDITLIAKRFINCSVGCQFVYEWFGRLY